MSVKSFLSHTLGAGDPAGNTRLSRGGNSVHQGLLRPLLEAREPGWMLGEGGKLTRY